MARSNRPSYVIEDTSREPGLLKFLVCNIAVILLLYVVMGGVVFIGSVILYGTLDIDIKMWSTTWHVSQMSMTLVLYIWLLSREPDWLLSRKPSKKR